MFDFLPAAESVALQNAPLVQVVAQLRFNAQSTLATPQGVSVLHDELADVYPRLLSEQQAMITATPGGVTTASVPQWRFTDLTGQWSVVVGPESLARETSGYETWESLRARLDPAVTALDEVTHPRVRERIGLRYVNHVPASDNGSFAGRIRDDMLGLGRMDEWRSSSLLSLTQTVVVDDQSQLALRFGTGTGLAVPPNTFILDIDCYDEHPVKFEANEVMDYFNRLNDAAYRCFSFCLTEDFRESLRG